MLSERTNAKSAYSFLRPPKPNPKSPATELEDVPAVSRKSAPRDIEVTAKQGMVLSPCIRSWESEFLLGVGLGEIHNCRRLRKMGRELLGVVYSSVVCLRSRPSGGGGGGAGGGSPVLITYRERCTYHITPRGYGAIPPMDTD